MTSDAIHVRRPRLDFNREIERFYLDDNPIKTHVFNALNLLFPDGERFFVKAVHDHQKEIDDPALLRDMKAFSGQEGQHANQHERFFVVLKAQGYRMGPVVHQFRKVEAFGKRLPRSLRLSITAGAEHYTATLAALLLENDMLEHCDPTLRDLMMWHAVEEIEHKHVAYDVLAKLYPYNYPLRMFGYMLATLVITGFTVAGVRLLLAQDLREKRLRRVHLVQARARLVHGEKEKRFRRGVRKAFLRYLVPGFHPNQQDDQHVLARYAPLVAQAAQ